MIVWGHFECQKTHKMLCGRGEEKGMNQSGCGKVWMMDGFLDDKKHVSINENSPL